MAWSNPEVIYKALMGLRANTASHKMGLKHVCPALRPLALSQFALSPAKEYIFSVASKSPFPGPPGGSLSNDITVRGAKGRAVTWCHLVKRASPQIE